MEGCVRFDRNEPRREDNWPCMNTTNTLSHSHEVTIISCPSHAQPASEQMSLCLRDSGPPTPRCVAHSNGFLRLESLPMVTSHHRCVTIAGRKGKTKQNGSTNPVVEGCV